MIKNVTTKWLKSWNACEDGIEWFESQTETDPLKLIKKLIEIGELSHANYSITAIMTRKQRLQYAVFAAESVLHIFKQKFPNDIRPRLAIEAAR